MVNSVADLPPGTYCDCYGNNVDVATVGRVQYAQQPDCPSTSDYPWTYEPDFPNHQLGKKSFTSRLGTFYRIFKSFSIW